EFRDFSAQGLPGLKKKSPQVAPVLEEAEEEQSVEEKPKDVEPLGAREPTEKEVVPKVEDQTTDQTAIKGAEPQPEAQTESTIGSTGEKSIEVPNEVPSIPSTVFDPRKCRATSAPLDGHGSKHSEDDTFPDINFFRRDYHTIKSL